MANADFITDLMGNKTNNTGVAGALQTKLQGNEGNVAWADSNTGGQQQQQQTGNTWGAFSNKLEGFDANKMQSGHSSPKYAFGQVMSQFDPKGGITQAMLDKLNALGMGTVSGKIGGDKISVTGNVDPRFQGVTEFDILRDLEGGGGWQWNGLNGSAADGISGNGGSSAAMDMSSLADAYKANTVVNNMASGAGSNIAKILNESNPAQSSTLQNANRSVLNEFNPTQTTTKQGVTNKNESNPTQSTTATTGTTTANTTVAGGTGNTGGAAGTEMVAGQLTYKEDPLKALGGGVQLTTGEWVPKSRTDLIQKFGIRGQTGTTSGTGTGTSGTGTNTGGTTGTGAKSDKEALMEKLRTRMEQELKIDKNDPIIRNQSDAYAAQAERMRRNYLADAAEGSSPFATGAMRNEARMTGEKLAQDAAGFEAELMGRELSARRQEIQHALDSMGNLLTEAERQALQRELAKADNDLKKYGIDLQNSQFYAGLSQADKHFLAQLSQTDRLAKLDNAFRYAQLGQNDSQFRDQMGFNTADRQAYWDAIRRGIL